MQARRYLRDVDDISTTITLDAVPVTIRANSSFTDLVSAPHD